MPSSAERTDPLRVALRAVALALLLVLSATCGAWAQDEAAQPPAAEAWAALIEEGQEFAANPEAPTEALESIRDRLLRMRSAAIDYENASAGRIADVNARLQTLGPPPAEGATESDEIAQRRASINAELSAAQAPVLEAQDFQRRAEALIRDIDKIVRGTFCGGTAQPGAVAPVAPALGRHHRGAARQSSGPARARGRDPGRSAVARRADAPDSAGPAARRHRHRDRVRAAGADDGVGRVRARQGDQRQDHRAPRSLPQLQPSDRAGGRGGTAVRGARPGCGGEPHGGFAGVPTAELRGGDHRGELAREQRVRAEAARLPPGAARRRRGPDRRLADDRAWGSRRPVHVPAPLCRRLRHVAGRGGDFGVPAVPVRRRADVGDLAAAARDAPGDRGAGPRRAGGRAHRRAQSRDPPDRRTRHLDRRVRLPRRSRRQAISRRRATCSIRRSSRWR